MPRQYEEINKPDLNFTETIKKEVIAKLISAGNELRKDLKELSDYGDVLDIIRNRNAFIGFFTAGYDVRRLAGVVFKLVNLEKRLTNFVLFSIIAIISGLIKYREIEEYLQEVKKQNSIIEYIIEEELIKEIFKSAEMFDQKFNTMETNLKIIFERLTRNEQTVKKNSESINRIESDFKELQMEIVKLKRRVKILSAMTLGIPVLAIFLILLLL
jgi:hypothetical protein